VSFSYFVRYDISVSDLPGFLERYRKVHVPLVSTWPGLQRMVLHTPMDSGNASFMMQLEFDSEKAINDGFKKLMQFEGSLVQEAMRAEELWRSPWLDANEEQA
jgi:hypothetical protein